jgi:hypothetical protein
LGGSISPNVGSYYHNLKRRTLTILQGVQGKFEEYEKEVAQIDEMILALMKPERYAEKESELVRNFDRNCVSLTLHMNIQRPEKMPVRAFLGALKDLKEYLKPAKNNRNGKSN